MLERVLTEQRVTIGCVINASTPPTNCVAIDCQEPVDYHYYCNYSCSGEFSELDQAIYEMLNIINSNLIRTRIADNFFVDFIDVQYRFYNNPTLLLQALDNYEIDGKL